MSSATRPTNRSPAKRDDYHRRHGDLRLRRNRPGPSRTERRLEIDHIRDVSDRHPGMDLPGRCVSKVRLRRTRRNIATQRSCDIRFGMSAMKRTLEPVSDTPTTCPVRFPLQPSCCRTVCTDPYIRLASACLGTQRTGPFRYRKPRATRRSKILCCCGTERNEPPDGIWSSP